MINLEWRSVQHGYDYKAYLQQQVQDIQEDIDDLSNNSNTAPKMGYYATSAEFTVDSLTRISGALADRYGLTGSADLKKLEMITKMELGEHPDIAGNLKIKNKKIYILKNKNFPEGKEITKADVTNGFVEENKNKISFNKDDVKEELETNRRTSLEFVFSLDKSISYLFFSDLITPEQRKLLQEIIFEAKHKTMEQIISPLLVTADGKKGEMLFYDFFHLDNRDQDPHLHIHSNVSNLILLPDGTYKAIEPRELFKHGTAERIDFQFKSIVLDMLKEKLPEIPVEAYDKDFQTVDAKQSGFTEIKDFRVAFDDASTKSIRAKYTVDKKIKDRIIADKQEAFQRNKSALKMLKIAFEGKYFTEEKYLEQVGNENAEYQAVYRHLNSRKHNKQVQRELVEKKAQTTLENKHTELAARTTELNLSLKDKSRVQSPRRNYTEDEILENLTNRNPKFTKNELIRDLAKYRGLGVEAEMVANRILKNNADIFAFPTSANNNNPYDQPTFTLKSLVKLEQENMVLLERIAGKERKSYSVASALEDIEQKQDIKFKGEQADYIANVYSHHGISLVVGLPGTGKSFAMKHAVAMAKKKNIKTYGLAPTGKVATDIENEVKPDVAATIDKFLLDLDKGKVALQATDVIFVDEAGMIGTRNYNRLLKAVEVSGAKLVLVGDNNQLDPVSAGNTFNEFINAHADKKFTSILSEITRQKNKDALKVAQKVSGSESMVAQGGTAQEQLKFWQTQRQAAQHTKEAFDFLETIGRVHQYETTKEMLANVVQQFNKLLESYEDKLLLASTNSTVDALNNSVQEQRLEKGELQSEAVELNGKNFYCGDRIIVKKNTKEVKNGDIGTIVGIKVDNSLVIRFDSGETKIINPEKTKIDLGYAMTVHKSQGITKKQTFHVGEDSQLNNAQLFNVAATRNTQHYNFFAVSLEYEAIRQSYCRSSNKMSLLEVGEIIDKNSDKLNNSDAQILLESKVLKLEIAIKHNLEETVLAGIAQEEKKLLVDKQKEQKIREQSYRDHFDDPIYSHPTYEEVVSKLQHLLRLQGKDDSSLTYYLSKLDGEFIRDVEDKALQRKIIIEELDFLYIVEKDELTEQGIYKEPVLLKESKKPAPKIQPPQPWLSI